MKLTDELLLKYAQGDLGVDLAADIEQALQQDAVASERLRLIKLSGTALNAEANKSPQQQDMIELAQSILAGDLDPHAPSDIETLPFAKARTSSSTRWSGMQMAASIALLAIGLGVGLGTGYFARDLTSAPPPTSAGQAVAANPVWLVRVVDYHTLYVRETVAPARANAQIIADLKGRFAAILGQSITIPDLGKERLEFRRGQYLKFEDSPIIQLAYLPKDTGKPVALCLKASKGPDSKPSYSYLNGLGVMRWHQSGIDYVLVGDLPEQRLRSAAQNAQSQIGQGQRI